MKRVVVLGTGLVGKAIVKDLSPDFEIIAVDRDEQALSGFNPDRPIKTMCVDLAEPRQIKEVVETANIVIDALPGFLGRMALQAVIEAGKDVVDIAFFPEDPFELDDLARQKGVVAVVDFGVAPGMSNVLLGHEVKRMHSVERFECLVGGLPVVRRWPFDYKAPFSPADVLEEYTRPARMVENGTVVIRPALSEPELIHFDDIGTLEAFNTDGLRTLLRTMHIPYMKEKTMRYPGHIKLMEALREAGFFDIRPLNVKGTTIIPRDVTAAIMAPSWKLAEGEEEYTLMRVTIEGTGPDGGREKVTYNLLDRYDRDSGVSSMARTTGYACTGAVWLLAAGKWTQPGICPPEIIGTDENCFRLLMEHLVARGVNYHRSVSCG